MMISADNSVPHNLSFNISLEEVLPTKVTSCDDFFDIIKKKDSLAGLLYKIERITSGASVLSKPIEDLQHRGNDEEETCSNPWEISSSNVGFVTVADTIRKPMLKNRPLHHEFNTNNNDMHFTNEGSEGGEEDDPFLPLPWEPNRSPSFSHLDDDDDEVLCDVLSILDYASSEGHMNNQVEDKTAEGKKRMHCFGINQASSSPSSSTQSSRKRRRLNNMCEARTAVTKISTPLVAPSLEMVKRYQECLQRSTQSQKALQEFDRRNGLPKSHCQTMVNSSRSRKQLQSGFILAKWNGKPLLDIPGTKVLGLHDSRCLLNQVS